MRGISTVGGGARPLRPSDAGLFRNAADFIERHGWIQGRLQNTFSGAVCTIGALQGCPLPPGMHAPVDIDEFYRFIGGDIDTWNDAPERTMEEVCKTLRTFADILEHGEDSGL